MLLRHQDLTLCALTTLPVWSSLPHFSLIIFHWVPSPQHWLRHLQSISFYFSIYPCNLFTADTESFVRRAFPLIEILMTVPTAENTIPWPLHSNRLVVGNGGWVGFRLESGGKRLSWQRGVLLKRQELRTPLSATTLASAPPPRVSIHASTCWTPSEHRNPLTCHRAAQCCSSYREARQTIQSFLLFTKVQKNHSPKMTN